MCRYLHALTPEFSNVRQSNNSSLNVFLCISTWTNIFRVGDKYLKTIIYIYMHLSAFYNIPEYWSHKICSHHRVFFFFFSFITYYYRSISERFFLFTMRFVHICIWCKYLLLSNYEYLGSGHLLKIESSNPSFSCAITF